MKTTRTAWLLAAALGLGTGAAHAQFAMVPAPQIAGAPVPSAADTTDGYKKDAARHLYGAYASQIYRGKLPPLLFGIAIVETRLDEKGNVIEVAMLRPPAAKEVGPWVVQLIKSASPFPAPARLGLTRFSEIWLVDKSGRFQLDTLTEGQN